MKGVQTSVELKNAHVICESSMCDGRISLPFSQHLIFCLILSSCGSFGVVVSASLLLSEDRWFEPGKEHSFCHFLFLLQFAFSVRVSWVFYVH